MKLSELTPDSLNKKITFESYGLEHTGLLIEYRIIQPKQYVPRLANGQIAKTSQPSRNYWHNNCQLVIMNQSFGIDVPIIYTSLPLDTHIVLNESIIENL